MPTSSENKFHLGICMAGAITAGSYTAGVIDYLLETMARWEDQKSKNREAILKREPLPFPDVPMYDVVIDVISGASAGGMCAAITTAMLAEGINYEDLSTGKSKMRKAWIDLDDENTEEGTIKKMLETDDLKKDGFVSLLNSKVLSNISDKMVRQLDETNFPPYVDKKLDTILTLANLRGVPYDIEFRSTSGMKKHTMSHHKDFMHFKLNTETDDASDFLPLHFSSLYDIQLLRESAVATGAFPVGLKSRHLARNEKYVYNKANRTIGLTDAINGNANGNSNTERNLHIEVHKSPVQNTYHSMNIDGGTFNNEPFGEAERILNSKAGKRKGQDIGFHDTNRSILMIDPFPCVDEENPANEKNAALTYVGPRIIKALRAQSSFKASDILDAYSDNNYLKYLIVPSKNNVKEPLCCATLDAFGGFLYKEFREHDYNLGKRNAQRFLQKHFVMPFFLNDPEKNNPIHRNWTEKAIEKYHVDEEASDQLYLPIIPDMQKGILKLDDPKPKKYPISKLKELEKPMKLRIDAILDSLASLTEEKKEEESSEAVKDWYKESRFMKFVKSFGLFIAKPFVYLILRAVRKKIARVMHEGVIKWIIRDLEKANLLDDRS